MPLLSDHELRQREDEAFARGVLTGVLLACVSIASVVGIVAWAVLQ
jgi:hypothetical protein